jgi:hypothetical protein
VFPLIAPLLALAQPPTYPPVPPPPDLPPPINLSHPPPPVLPPVVTPGAGVPASLAAAGPALAQLACPGPGAHPFQRLPRVCYVPACPCDDAAGGAPAPVHWVKEFHEAAHVPLPRFTADGLAVCREGLLVYEGMRLTVYPNGVYDVAFTAEVPDMPVTLRLQLVFNNPPGYTPGEYRLTLPPFRLEPRPDARPGDPSANVLHVAHRGYSTLLAAGHRVDAAWSVARVGTARFGTPVAVTDPTPGP